MENKKGYIAFNKDSLLHYEVGKTYAIKNYGIPTKKLLSYSLTYVGAVNQLIVDDTTILVEIEVMGTEHEVMFGLSFTNKLKVLRIVPETEHQLFKKENGKLTYATDASYEQFITYNEDGSKEVMTYHYDPKAPCKAEQYCKLKTNTITDVKGNKVLETTDDNNEHKVATLCYNDANLCTSCRLIKVEKDNNGKLLPSTEVCTEEYYTYDDKGEVTSYKNSRGDNTVYKYNNAGNKIKIKTIKGITSIYVMDVNNNVVTNIDSDGTIYNYTYNEHNKLIHKTHNMPIHSKTGSKVYEAWFTYDKKHRCTCHHDTFGFVETFTYNDDNTIETHATSTGNLNTSIYDNAKRTIYNANSHCECEITQYADRTSNTVLYYKHSNGTEWELIIEGDTTSYSELTSHEATEVVATLYDKIENAYQERVNSRVNVSCLPQEVIKSKLEFDNIIYNIVNKYVLDKKIKLNEPFSFKDAEMLRNLYPKVEALFKNKLYQLLYKSE